MVMGAHASSRWRSNGEAGAATINWRHRCTVAVRTPLWPCPRCKGINICQILWCTKKKSKSITGFRRRRSTKVSKGAKAEMEVGNGDNFIKHLWPDFDKSKQRP
jgi:hypothetical protein